MACNWVRPAAFHTQTQRQKFDTVQAWVYFDASLRVPAHCARVSTPYLVCQMPGESSPASPHRKRSWRGRLWDDFLRNSSGLQFEPGNCKWNASRTRSATEAKLLNCDPASLNRFRSLIAHWLQMRALRVKPQKLVNKPTPQRDTSDIPVVLRLPTT